MFEVAHETKLQSLSLWLASLSPILPVMEILLSMVLNLRSLRILGITFNSKLTFETRLREVVSKAARSFGVVCRAGKLFDFPRVPMSCSNEFILSNLEYCASVWMPSAESHLNLLDSGSQCGKVA